MFPEIQNEYCVLLKMQWEKLIFLLTEASFNHAVKLHGHWFVQWLKNEPMARQRSCKSLWRRSPPEWAEPSGYTSGCFAIGKLRFLRLKQWLYSTANMQYSFHISGNRGYNTNRVCSLSILHFVLRLVSNAMGTQFNHTVLTGNALTVAVIVVQRELHEPQ